MAYADKLSPVPNQDNIVPNGLATFSWLEWFRQVRDILNEVNYSREYAGFRQSTSQTTSVINTPKVIPFEQYQEDGITIVDGSKVTISRTGLYKVDFSTQITSSSASTKTVWFWPRVNGVDVAGFTMKHSVAGSTATEVVSRQGIFPLNAGDYLEAWWATDDLNITLEAIAATAFSPASPAALLAVVQLR